MQDTSSDNGGSIMTSFLVFSGVQRKYRSIQGCKREKYKIIKAKRQNMKTHIVKISNQGR